MKRPSTSANRAPIGTLPPPYRHAVRSVHEFRHFMPGLSPDELRLQRALLDQHSSRVALVAWVMAAAVVAVLVAVLAGAPA